MKSCFMFLKPFLLLSLLVFFFACDLYYSPFLSTTYVRPAQDTFPLMYGDRISGTIPSPWSCSVNPRSVLYVHSGTKALEMTVNGGWGGFVIKAVNSVIIDVGTYTYLSFYINGGENSGQNLRVYLRDESGAQIGPEAPINNYITVAANTWQQVLIPLSFYSTNSFTFRYLVFQDNNNSTFTVYLDDIEFL